MNSFENMGERWRTMRFNPLRSLTPARLGAALDAWGAGRLRDAALIWEAIADREAIVRSVLLKRAAAVSRLGWEIVVPNADDPAGAAHKETLKWFYDNLTATDATDLNVRSGMSGLVRQMMGAVLQRYAVHEIIWQRGNAGLTAEMRQVPIYFFENRSGKLRYTGPEPCIDGVPLDGDGWHVTVADGLGSALSILYMFRRLAVQDWVSYSEKFSIPGVLGRTSAKNGSEEADAMAESVAAFASDWVGVLTGDDGSIPEPIKILTTGGGGTELPQKELAEYCDRMIAGLVRGADLATISRENGRGASLQRGETEALLQDDCQMISESLQQLDKQVLQMAHGNEAPAAYTKINPPATVDTAKDIAIDTRLAELGIMQNPKTLAERYGRTHARQAGRRTSSHPIANQSTNPSPNK